jgi:hypothetical protein
MAEQYVLLRGTHQSRRPDGEVDWFYAGDLVELTDEEYEAFSDKFEKASKKDIAEAKAAAKAEAKAEADDEGLTRSEVIKGKATLKKLRGV